MNRKMSILHIGFIDGRGHSGVDIVVPKYLQYQSEYANVALLNLSSHSQDIETCSYKVFYLKNARSSMSDLPSPYDHPDLVVFHEVYRSEFVRIAKRLMQHGIPYIITPHVSLTDTAQNHKKIKKIIGNVVMFNEFVNNAKAIHFLSESEKSQSIRFNHLPSFVRNNGIEIVGRSKYVFNKNKLRLIYVGRLDTYIKGIDRIIKAASIIRHQMIEEDIQISIYGADQDGNRAKLEKMIHEKELSKLVSLKEAIYGDDKVKEILTNDCFIQLSRTEGQPLAVMEAMDLGMPCILTPGTTFAEIASSHSVGISTTDKVEDIAHTIIAIRHGEYRLEDISMRTSHYAEVNFDWNKLGKLMIKDYQEVVKHSV